MNNKKPSSCWVGHISAKIRFPMGCSCATLTARAMLKYWRTFKRLGLMGSKHEGKKNYLKHIDFLEHFSIQDCAKTHLQQSRISKIFPGEKPPDPRSKGRPRLTRPGGAAASNAPRAGEGRGEGRGGGGEGGGGGGGWGRGVGAEEENVQFRHLPNPTFTT